MSIVGKLGKRARTFDPVSKRVRELALSTQDLGKQPLEVHVSAEADHHPNSGGGE